MSMTDREIVERLREVSQCLAVGDPVRVQAVCRDAANAIDTLIKHFLSEMLKNQRLTKERDEAIEALRNCADSMGNVAAKFLESKDPTFDAADFKGSLSRARSILSKHEVKP